MPTLTQLILLALGCFGTIFGGLLLWGIKALISTVIKTAFEIEKLNSHIEKLTKTYEDVDQIKKDLNALGSKIRGQ